MNITGKQSPTIKENTIMNTSNKTLLRTFTTSTRKQARKLSQALKQDDIVTPTVKSLSGWLVGARIKRPVAKKTFIVSNNKAVAV